MQIFEFYFNPKLKPDLIFDSFCYEPENIYEKRVGGLYMLGVLKNALPQNVHFLDKLSGLIKDRYYTPTARSPEKSLKESLKRANEFLEDLTKKGDVSWLGNLSFVALSLKKFELNFSKVGDFKIFLLRGKKITDIDEKVKFAEIEPYPLKIFLNVVSGKLAEDDVILVLSKEICDFFQKEDILNQIIKTFPFNEKKFREILNAKEERFRQLSGICLLILLTKEKLAPRKETILTKPKVKEFSLKEVFALPLLAFFKKRKLPKPKIPEIKIKKPKIKFLKLPKLRFPQLAIFTKLSTTFRRMVLDKLAIFQEKTKALIRNKNIVLVLGLIFLLLFGFLIFQREAKKQLKEYQITLSQIQEKVETAESFLILKSPQSLKEANFLFKESWEELLPITKIASSLPKDFQGEIFSLKEEILENLYQLNKLVEIPEPELLFEFKLGEFVPQKMIFDGKNLYFFTPYAQNLFKVTKQGSGQPIETSQRFNLAILTDSEILFFSKPNNIISFKEEQFSETFYLESPYLNFDFNSFSIFKSNLYFLDKNRGQIVKYPYLNDLKWDFPKLWLSDETQKVIGANSLTVDGSVWVLGKNSIDKYYGGTLQETLTLDFFPYPENLSKIFTSSPLPYLYILEPTKQRIIILNKSAKVVQQFQSEKFDNLLDFAVSKDGKTIWLLSGLKVYQIEF